VSAPSKTRPAVDFVVPFAGSAAALEELRERLRALDLGGSDTLTIVDNRPAGAPAVDGTLRAPERRSSYFARNRGAAAGTNPWLMFLDADVEPPPDLAGRLFAEEPADRTAVLAGGVVDGPLEPHARQPAAARFAMLHASMSQANTLLDGPWSYAQTANCAVRRAAFEAVGGFRDHIRSGGDADLCFRLRALGWQIEPRERAAVVHRSRRTLRKLLRQRARHGSGAAWLDRQHPGSFPRARRLGLVKWTLQSFAGAAVARARGRREDALIGVVEPLWVWAFELGRLFPNEVGEG
jgi:GT2 family glycosyltransferase